MIAALQTRWLRVIAAALALAQIAVHGSMIWARASILRNGTEIVLEVRPIDPRDLLRHRDRNGQCAEDQAGGLLSDPDGRLALRQGKRGERRQEKREGKAFHAVAKQ